VRPTRGLTAPGVHEERKKREVREGHLGVDPLDASEEVELLVLLEEDSRLQLLQQDRLSLTEDLMTPPELAADQTRLGLELCRGHSSVWRRRGNHWTSGRKERGRCRV
jgi:hypothetical protein